MLGDNGAKTGIWASEARGEERGGRKQKRWVEKQRDAIKHELSERSTSNYNDKPAWLAAVCL